ncbi:hypothetical protein PtrSN002B_005767 [Pyrenophora tritici-repentis]|uniref:Uncharacterized protein n=2 Tax=Pyrenophora tritici-repentis TaxID=45151 RepID=A0A2W1DMS2_9PLEO|nr:uncharacterized protein PTRG_11496 [Pyrenophora tritici-repentis Pt-1C-BFP]KAA8624519.1 hypothetical protein PtrV1_00199 [Pyrenophora tritici-repentis]EDU44546.1 predicted protein [Pyrenophora tritici-repentis Pt-1C-BFP]KAF7452920.1 hypothetical protein A1F99_001780 [Pyrenophora tritici-repentis]KAF7575960.1 hypothetical protein PtrM4_002000 [Pyrenophora tritici-repentis]KAG9377653.1 hypothetical protein A1F94_012056 [Pyrenophora tritici-repentis]
MKFSTSIVTIGFAVFRSVAAQSPTTTITVTPYCAPAPTDESVSRADVPVPSCAGGANETKPMIVSMSGGMMPTATMSGGGAMFTGAATRMDAGLMGVGLVGGLMVAMMG